jgi:hypothetical protein
MSFDCSNYQHQLLRKTTEKPGAYEHVYQSIFLDKSNEALWTWNEIDESKIIQRKWWHQLGHRWQHYLRVVPGMMFINGRNNTYFAGSWTLVVSASVNMLLSPPEVYGGLPLTADRFGRKSRTCTSWPVSVASRLPIALVPHIKSLTISRRVFLVNISSPTVCSTRGRRSDGTRTKQNELSEKHGLRQLIKRLPGPASAVSYGLDIRCRVVGLVVVMGDIHIYPLFHVTTTWCPEADRTRVKRTP